jgi:methanogenic corrinoid protein MtbC1
VHPLLNQFLELIENEDKEKCVEFVRSVLVNQEIDIISLYNEILTPALNEMDCKESEIKYCIWKEHVRSSIIRTILECCYPYILKERDSKYGNVQSKGNVVIICPSEEFHEIGARMVSDYFTLLGFDVTFVGANTPLDNTIAGIKFSKPEYVAISVTNFYNLSAARATILELNKLRNSEKLIFKILVGGHAFKTNPDIYKEMGADLQLQTLNDLIALTRAGGD